MRQATLATTGCMMAGALVGALAGALAGMALAQATPRQANGAAPATRAAGPADQLPAAALLEKAIYTEQTVGDVDAAMALYRQVIEQAKANRPYVAQAHYRLAMCLLQ